MKKAFTLIELIVVIAIIAILAAIIAPNAFKAIEKAKITRVVADLKSMKTAALAYYADTGRWPLEKPAGDPTTPPCSGGGPWVEVYNSSLMEDTGISGWDGPYLDNPNVATPWGNIYAFYIYDANDNGIDLDLSIILSNHCYPTAGVYCPPITHKIAQRMDDLIDNGNLSDGNFRRHPCHPEDFEVTEPFYILQFD